jgi:hypothetical protein
MLAVNRQPSFRQIDSMRRPAFKHRACKKYQYLQEISENDEDFLFPQNHIREKILNSPEYVIFYRLPRQNDRLRSRNPYSQTDLNLVASYLIYVSF